MALKPKVTTITNLSKTLKLALKMGKPKGKSPRIKKLTKKKGLEKETNPSKYTLDELLDKAEEVMDTYNYELALQFCQKALEMNPDHARALELCSGLLLEAGDIENAKHCLGRAVTVQPDQGYSKYLSLAQLFEGREALDLYQKGISLMQKEHEDRLQDVAGAEATDKSDLPKEISKVFCAVAELFMTDLCDEPDAEQNCVDSFENAIKTDPSNPEAWQTKARYLLIREKFDECKEAIQKSLDLWLPRYQAFMENKEDIQEFDPVEVCPLLYTTRIATSKLLIELEMYDEADQVLDGLLEEDDQVVETWYLLGWLNRLRAETTKEDGYDGNARYYLNKALAVHKKNPTDDEAMVQHVHELLAELGPDDEEGGDDEDDENWEDVASSDDDNDGVDAMEADDQ